jgi:thiamine pyridinylase
MGQGRSGIPQNLKAMFARAVIAVIGIATCVAFIAPAATAADTGGYQSSPLRVVLYPFIPDYEGFKRQIAGEFAALPQGKGIAIQFLDLADGYYDPSSQKFVGAAQADVYELDSVLLTDFVNQRKIRQLPSELLPKQGEFLQSAQKRTFIGEVAYGYPHWVCANFLFYRKGDSAVADAATLAGLEQTLGSQEQGQQELLGDFKGKSTLGEFYLMSLFDRYGTWAAVESHLGGLEQTQVNDVMRLAALCRQGYCHDEGRHDKTGSYGGDFARGKARTLVGYSETLYYVGAEKRLCGDADGCLSPDELDAGLVPVDDRGVTPMVWVDSFVISASCTGQCERNVLAFVRFVNSEETQRLVLTGSPPRYLLPARASLYSDPTVLKAAPLYPKLKSLVENAESPSSPGLNARLRDDGKAIDGLLPKSAQP